MRIRTAIIAASFLVGLTASTAFAQTAEQYNRAAQALQSCGSAAGALIPECATVRSAFTANPGAVTSAFSNAGAVGLTNNYGLSGDALARLLSTAPTAAQARAATTDSTMAIANGAAAYRACVTVNAANWQSCLPLLNGGAVPAGLGIPAPTQALAPAPAPVRAAPIDPLSMASAPRPAAPAAPVPAPAAAPANNPMSVLGF